MADIGGATSFIIFIFDKIKGRYQSPNSMTKLTAEQVTELRCWTIVRQLAEQLDLLKRSNASRDAIESKTAEVSTKIRECGQLAPA